MRDDDTESEYYALTYPEIDERLGLTPGEAKKVCDRVLRRWQRVYQKRYRWKPVERILKG